VTIKAWPIKVFNSKKSIRGICFISFDLNESLILTGCGFCGSIKEMEIKNRRANDS
jgi:hypothetical protein